MPDQSRGESRLGGRRPGREFLAEYRPELLELVFEDGPPSTPGLHVWEGRAVSSGIAATFEGRWRPADADDLLLADEPVE